LLIYDTEWTSKKVKVCPREEQWLQILLEKIDLKNLHHKLTSAIWNDLTNLFQSKSNLWPHLNLNVNFKNFIHFEFIWCLPNEQKNHFGNEIVVVNVSLAIWEETPTFWFIDKIYIFTKVDTKIGFVECKIVLNILSYHFCNSFTNFSDDLSLFSNLLRSTRFFKWKLDSLYCSEQNKGN